VRSVAAARLICSVWPHEALSDHNPEGR
jgi:hypothetical protein